MNSPENELSYWNLTFLTFQAVFQTIIICIFGYLAARYNILTPSVQRHVSTLNVQLFTPCLIFSKLASSLSVKSLINIAVVPIFFVISTGVTYLCSLLVSRIWKFSKREANFVTAMAVFGNSNSLPVSLTVQLAYTLPLKWPDLGNDNADDVASRGILYLLVFQQLGQILRWSWGYNTLLAKPENNEEEGSTQQNEDEEQPLLDTHQPNYDVVVGNDRDDRTTTNNNNDDDEQRYRQEESDEPHGNKNTNNKPRRKTSISKQPHGQMNSRQVLSELSSPDNSSTESLNILARRRTSMFGSEESLPMASLNNAKYMLIKVYHRVMAFMNVPLWSMLISIIVGSVPAFKKTLFEDDGFIQNTVTQAIEQLGGVAIPMILVVLGSNLAPNNESEPSKNYSKIVTASLLSRMIIPPIIMLPIIALSVKYIQVSILDDPIFLLVAFILTIAPPAIQLSQICQLNQVFEKEMAGVLFWGYVVLTLPSTVLIVVVSQQVLIWAGVTVS